MIGVNLVFSGFQLSSGSNRTPFFATVVILLSSRHLTWTDRPSENAKTARRHTGCRAHFGFRFLRCVCPLFHPRIISVRSGRLGKFIYRATAPDLRTAPPYGSRYGFSTPSIRPPGQKGPHQIVATTTTGGRPAHRGRRNYSVARRDRRALVFHLSFLGASFVWLPRRMVWGARSLPPSPLLVASRTRGDSRR